MAVPRSLCLVGSLGLFKESSHRVPANQLSGPIRHLVTQGNCSRSNLVGWILRAILVGWRNRLVRFGITQRPVDAVKEIPGYLFNNITHFQLIQPTRGDGGFSVHRAKEIASNGPSRIGIAINVCSEDDPFLK